MEKMGGNPSKLVGRVVKFFTYRDKNLLERVVGLKKKVYEGMRSP